MMIKIPNNLSIPKVQDLYSQLFNSKEHTIDVHLPKKIEKPGFGLLFSYLQFLATWIRNERSGRLYLPIQDKKNLNSYLEDQEFVYPSVVLAWEKEIVSESGENIKKELKAPSKVYFEKMDFFELKGTSVPIYCFDHDKSSRGLSKHFYRNNRELFSEDALGLNLFRAYQKIGSHNTSVFRNSIKKSLESFNAIIHELFSNTHEHAKTNELGHTLYPNIRAVQLKFHKKPINKFVEDFHEFVGLVNYFNSDFSVNNQGDLYLIELSILDSGPGLVKRYEALSEYNLTIEEEIEIIKKCLYRHNTSAEGFRGEIKGIGLDRVLQTLDGKGFLRIKTGRADVFRDMKTNRYNHHERASDIQLNDWYSNSPTKYTTYLPTVGTLLSIFYPLDYIQQ